MQDLYRTRDGMRGIPHHVATATDVSNIFSLSELRERAVILMNKIYKSCHEILFVDMSDILEEFYTVDSFVLVNPLSPSNFQLKGNIHTHSTGSDGVDTPTAIVTAYRDAGYDFIALTDHSVVTSDPSVSGIIFIPGCVEVSTSPHYNTWTGISKYCLNHPTWSNADPDFFTDPFGFVEIFNSIEYDTRNSAINNFYFDYILTMGLQCFCIASDDCHDIAGTEFQRGWIVANTATEDLAGILAAINAGNFYASTGNDISVAVDGLEITATSSELATFRFIGAYGTVLKTESSVLTSSYVVEGWEKYVRIESLSANGHAWCQPIFLTETV